MPLRSRHSLISALDVLRLRGQRAPLSVRVVTCAGEATEGSLFPFSVDTRGAGLSVATFAEIYFFPDYDIQSLEVWERSWFGLGPYGWRVWFERRDA